MKKQSLYITLFVSLLLFGSCEKVIDLELDKATEWMVVDAVVSNFPDQTEIKLSNSVGIFENVNFPQVSGAEVRLSDSEGNSFLLDEVETGIYKKEHFRGKEGVDYQLDILYAGSTIHANSRMPQIVELDSLELVVSERGFMGSDEKAYSLKIHYTDPANIKNYYKFDIFKNNELLDGFVVSNDLFYDGIHTYAFYMNAEIASNDTVRVQLSSIDEKNYSYFLVLSQSGSPFSIAPGNPISTIEGNAIGYFGAFAQSSLELIIP
ncbi:MAG: DUF4249 domain-containing protein [Bacteroidales bacterium]|nr:DUF4249 domain-containing protein [Bacteroidales bacterium]